MSKEKVHSTSVRRTLTLTGAAFLLLYGLYQAWLWWLRHESLLRAGERVVNALENKDLDTLWFYSLASEKDAYGIDRPTFNRFFREFVFVITGELRPSDLIKELSSDGEYGSLVRTYLDGKREVPLELTMVRTADGPKTHVISSAIFLVFRTKYPCEDVPLAKREWTTRYLGALNEHQQLEALGIRGLVGGEPGQPLVRWADDLSVLRPHAHLVD